MNSRIISCVGIALIMFCIYPSATSEAQMFEPVLEYEVGHSPRSVAIADLNTDGSEDLIVANSIGDSISVLLGNGDGTFQGAVHYGADDGPGSVAVDYLNGDGIPDLITANSLGDSVSVLLGNGDGTFGDTVNYPASDNPHSIAASDLDGDGCTDIAVTHGWIGHGSVLLGNGDGTFQAPVDIEAGEDCYSIAIDDLDQDNIPDLVVISQYNQASVLLGKGDATFQTAVDYEAGYASYSIATGDLNGDSISDLITANYVGNSVSALLGNGDGTFQEAIVSEVFGDPFSVAIGDLDGDGIPDLVTANFSPFDGDTSSVLLGNGDGTFLPAIYHLTGRRAYSVAVSDLDSDGSQDLVVANTWANKIAVLINVRVPGVTIFTDMSCVPTAGTVPFDSHLSVTLMNRVTDQPRLVAARIQVDLANGQTMANWKAGYQNIVGGSTTTSSWYQTIPALRSLIGDNLFTLVAEDVTPAPWNQPPYGASGYQAETSCTITAATHYTLPPLSKNGYPQ